MKQSATVHVLCKRATDNYLTFKLKDSVETKTVLHNSKHSVIRVFSLPRAL